MPAGGMLTAVGIGAGVGAIGGMFGKPSSSTTRIETGDATNLQKSIEPVDVSAFKELADMLQFGAGAGDVRAGRGAQLNFADMLAQYSKNGGIPDQAGMAQNMQAAKLAFSGQQTAIDQSLEQSRQAYARQAAISGRGPNDPVFMGMMNQERMRAQERLGAQETQFAAFGLPQQRLQYTAQLADVRGNLASQAMSNRQALLSLGNNLNSSERQWRLGQASRTTEGSEGGGMSGMFGGALAGAGAGFGLGSKMGLFGGGGGAATSGSGASFGGGFRQGMMGGGY